MPLLCKMRHTDSDTDLIEDCYTRLGYMPLEYYPMPLAHEHVKIGRLEAKRLESDRSWHEQGWNSVAIIHGGTCGLPFPD